MVAKVAAAAGGAVLAVALGAASVLVGFEHTLGAVALLGAILIGVFRPTLGLTLLVFSGTFTGVHIFQVGSFAATPDAVLSVPILVGVGLRYVLNGRGTASWQGWPLTLFLTIAASSFISAGDTSLLPKQLQLLAWAAILVAAASIQGEFGLERTLTSVVRGLATGVIVAGGQFVWLIGPGGSFLPEFAARNTVMGFNVGLFASIGVYVALLSVHESLLGKWTIRLLFLFSVVLLIAAQVRVTLISVVVTAMLLLYLRGMARVRGGAAAAATTGRGMRTVRRLTVGALIVGLVVVALEPARFTTFLESPAQLLDPTRSRDPNVLSRYVLWSEALDLTVQEPWVGHGFGAGAELAARVRIGNPLNDFHSVYFQVLVELGVLGALVWLLLLFRSVRRAFVTALEAARGVDYLMVALITTVALNGISGTLLQGGIATIVFILLGIDTRLDEQRPISWRGIEAGRATLAT